MKKIQLFVITMFSVIALQTASASSVNMVVNQIDGVQKRESESVIAFQNGLLDSFFDKGIIVTGENLNLNTKLSFSKVLMETKAGFFDYLLVVNAELDLKSQMILKSDWKIIDIDKEKEIANGSCENESSIKEPLKNAEKFGADVASKIYSSMGRW